MKKYIYSILLLLIFCSMVFAASLKPYAFPFIGRWQPSESPELIDDYGFQDIQNLRKDGKRLKGVSGHTKINTSNVWSATYKYPENGFHFTKDSPAESHVIVSARDSSGNNPILYQNETAIPSQGDFSGTALLTADTSAGLGRISLAPKGNMVYCNGEETMIWGGDELNVTSFIVSASAITTTITNPKDFSDEVRNTRQTGGEVAQITDGLDANTVLMLHCEGADASTTFTDSSDSGHTPTANGDAQIDTDFKKFGSASGIFDGTGDYVSYPDHANWNFGADEFTIDFWVRFSAVSGTQSLFYTQNTDQVYITHTAPSTLQVNIINGADTMLWNTTWTPAVDTWYHFALIRGWGGVTDDWAITVNGSSINTTTDTVVAPDVAAAVYIGGNAESTAYTMYGWLDEFRVSKGVARWQANFTSPVRPYKNIGLYWLVGTTRPIQGVKYYVNQANYTTSTMTAKEWNGSSWEDLTITDGTASGGISLAQTGSVTWATTEDTSETAMLADLSLYWYQFNLSAGEAEIYFCTVDAPIQTIKNIWSGDPATCVGFHAYDAGFWEDYTTHVNSPSTQAYSTDLFAAELDGLLNTEYVYAGFLDQTQAVKITMAANLNANAATVTVYYWDGSAWVSVGTVVDGTAEGGVALAKSGYISWNPPDKAEEFIQNLFGSSGYRTTTTYYGDDLDQFVGSAVIVSDGDPVIKNEYYEYGGFENTEAYYYKFVWSATLSADVLVDQVSGVPSEQPVNGYSSVDMFQNRTFLFSEKAGSKNVARYSAFDSPDIYNGPDSGLLIFGDDTKITASASLYNLYATAGVEQLIVTKANETYRVTGSSPESWSKKKISRNVGCIAPLSMVNCDISNINETNRRQIVLFQSDSGVFATDGANVYCISDDVACYWDKNDSRCIPTARLDDSVGEYDPDLRSYKLLISSGTGQATHNVELEYSLKSKEWTKLYRENGSGANPLQAIFVTHDTIGKTYSYGATNEGTVYRLENGNTWDSGQNAVAITQYVQTKDLMLDSEQPLFRHTNIEYIRLIFEDKATAATEDIDILHYGDQVLTTHGTNDQFVPTDIDIADGPYETRECTLGPFLYHSFKFTADMSTVADGMELTGLGIYYDPEKTIME